MQFLEMYRIHFFVAQTRSPAMKIEKRKEKRKRKRKSRKIKANSNRGPVSAVACYAVAEFRKPLTLLGAIVTG